MTKQRPNWRSYEAANLAAALIIAANPTYRGLMRAWALAVFGSLSQPRKENRMTTKYLSDLQLSTRLYHALVNAGIATVDDLLSYDRRQLNLLPGVGPHSVSEIEEALFSRGLQVPKIGMPMKKFWARHR